MARSQGFNVGDLRRQLEGLTDDLLVVVRGSDHSFSKITGAEIEYAEENRGDYYEYYGDESMSRGGKKTQIFLIDNE